MAISSEFQSKVLRRQKTPEEYRVYRAGLEWDVTDPIVIDGPDDFKSTQKWRDRLQPYHHQVTNLITFCRRLTVHQSFLVERGLLRLRPLTEILDGGVKNADKVEMWGVIAGKISAMQGGSKTRIESATLSPSRQLLAISCEIKTMLGFRVHQIGAVYDLTENRISGRSVEGKRRPDGWTPIS